MTPSEKNIVKGLVAVAWADGKVKEPEQGMLDGLLWAFGADENDEAEIREFAGKKRTLKDDIPLGELSREDREILLAHAALMTHADGKQTPAESKLLGSLIEVLEFDAEEAGPIVESARERAKSFASRV